MIDGIKRQLHQQVQNAFDQIARLNEAKQQLIRVLPTKEGFSLIKKNISYYLGFTR